MEELQLALKKAKNRRASGTENLNADLFKYASTSLKDKGLHLCSNKWPKHHISKD
jgi:hypothetical protein